MQSINFTELPPGRPPSFAQPRHRQLLENRRFGWGQRGLLCGLLAIAFVCGARAQSQNRQLEALLHDGQSELDAGDFARAVASFERATQMPPDNLEANGGLLLLFLQANPSLDAKYAAHSPIPTLHRDRH